MSQPDMIYRPLGRCGTRISIVGLGGWTTFGDSVRNEADAAAIIRTAFEAGVNFFDIADVYAHGESERLMGKLLSAFPRHHLVISSKVFFPMSEEVNDRGLSRKHIFESVEKSLKRISADYLDLYFCHRYDRDTPLEETVRAMEDLIRQGKILHWGTSQWTGDQIAAACWIARATGGYPPRVEQPQYNLIERERFETKALPAVEEHGLGVVAWSPLASGLLTGKYDGGIPKGTRLDRIEWLREKVLTERGLRIARALAPIAQRMGISRAQLALAWAIRQPGITSLILGATSAAQLKENIASVKMIPPDDIRAELNRLSAYSPS